MMWVMLFSRSNQNGYNFIISRHKMILVQNSGMKGNGKHTFLQGLLLMSVMLLWLFFKPPLKKRQKFYISMKHVEQMTVSKLLLSGAQSPACAHTRSLCAHLFPAREQFCSESGGLSWEYHTCDWRTPSHDSSYCSSNSFLKSQDIS